MSCAYGDRQPLEFEGRYLWHPTPAAVEQMPDQYDYLPRLVFERLTGFIPRGNPRVSQMVKAYATREAAMAALSRATQEAV